MQKWSPERRNEAVRLYRDGLSCSEIAKRLGATSRSAVIGVIQRARDIANPISGGSRNNGPKAKVKAFAVGGGRAYPQPVTIGLPPERQHDGEVIPMEALKSGACRYPVGDPGELGFGFCGRPQAPSGSYCQDHARVCFTGKPSSEAKVRVPHDIRAAARRLA